MGGRGNESEVQFFRSAALENGRGFAVAHLKSAPALVISRAGIGDLAVEHRFEAVHQLIGQLAELAVCRAAILTGRFTEIVPHQHNHRPVHLQLRVVRTRVGFGQGVKSVHRQLYFRQMYAGIDAGIHVSQIQREQQRGYLQPVHAEISHQRAVHVAVSLNGDVIHHPGWGYNHGIPSFRVYLR